ncbi:ACT domain-containing protein [Poseidonibacter antarcticus]|uniref:ACT domain-containing protein n=1 Tax=Poseidonibacter antarcticus TaxID=2478538 RepID=UPI000EF4F9C7|nr:ACT domain-containing protein [Poseidonibacter antarcticus]
MHFISKNRVDESGLSYESIFSKITLEIHSSLDVVGLTAAFSNKLTSYGISADVVAGYYHDHIFVQKEKAYSAIEALEELSK